MKIGRICDFFKNKTNENWKRGIKPEVGRILKSFKKKWSKDSTSFQIEFAGTGVRKCL